MPASALKDLLQYPGQFDHPMLQAAEILDDVLKLHNEGYQQIGITYSANYDQTKKITKAYADGKWQTNTVGGGQAVVIAAIEKLLATDVKYQSLQQIFRIIPITTCEKSGGLGAVKDEWLTTDLNRIEDFLKQSNHVLLGWKTNATRYAIGGNISKMLRPDQNEKIQTKLQQLKNNYPYVTKDKKRHP